MDRTYSFIQQQILTLLYFSNGKTHFAFLQYVINIKKEKLLHEISLLENKNIIKKENNFYILLEDRKENIYRFFDSFQYYHEKNKVVDVIIYFTQNNIKKMCSSALECAELLIVQKRYLELRFFYDILLTCFLKVHPSVNNREECVIFIDSSYNLLILFESFPFLMERIRTWYIKTSTLTNIIGYSNPNYAISVASGFLFNSNRIQDEEFFFETARENSKASLWKNLSGKEINLSHYLSIKYFLDGNFIKCINTVYNKDIKIEQEKQYYSRTLYVSAAISAVYLGEYDIALEMLNIGITHAEKQKKEYDIQTLLAVKAYVYVSKGEYRQTEKIAHAILKNTSNVITYGELWAVRALTCMYYRQDDIASAYNVYRKYIKEYAEDKILHIGFIFSSLILEVMTSWELAGFNLLPHENLHELLNQAKLSASCMLRNIALRSEMLILAQKHGWQDKAVSKRLEDCLRQARYITSPVQRAKGLLCAIRAALSKNDHEQALHYMKEVADTSARYGCPAIPNELEFLLKEDHKQTLSNIEKNFPVIRDEPLGKESGFIVHSESMQELLNKVSILAPRDTSVLILGESGVGKEHIARQLHEQSGRKGAFIAVNLASIPSELFESEFYGHKKGSFTGATYEKTGLLELANEGTLFLDEVGDIPPHIQVKLLRVLQEKNFTKIGGTKVQRSDFRIISATNKNLEEEVKNETFREDLYYRINVFSLRIPPLRDRQHDVIFIAEYFLELFSQKYNLLKQKFSPDDLRFLTSYSWPGNVRELKNYIERYVFMSDYEHNLDRTRLLGNTAVSDTEKSCRKENSETGKTNFAHTPLKTDNESFSNFMQSLAANPSKLPSIDELKNSYVEYVYTMTNGTVTGEGGMAEILGISKVTVYAWIEKLKLKEKYVMKMVRYFDNKHN